ncbi:HNH endonuclease [Tenacibaculum phage PTm1]|uniref:DNA-binding domain n=2 Tax=Shirahamavirus PTm1 TaxID=2846435 RepID=A0A5S9HXA7_9CAUD|nr:HNH endonuclease [Tenacibaculum phage PTm1]BBI90487.1 DNA-binding domain [Tenacibaculum phage PTm1]BBI90795.1 DNA-binding domain [Tenacibaculum phage PTm5]
MYLDKDLLVKNNKIYSKDTCVFIPNDVNVLITNRRNFRGCLPIGVTTSKNRNKYRSQINIYGKRIGLGYFDTPFDAFNAYKEAKENHIKDIANKYKNEPWMLDKLYNALMTYEVEITD